MADFLKSGEARLCSTGQIANRKGRLYGNIVAHIAHFEVNNSICSIASAFDY